MDSIRLKARAKINLGLDVTGVRGDGYHEVRMVMQTVGLYDRIIIKKAKDKGIWITTNLPYVPTNESNLMYKAADMLIKEFGISEGVSMSLNKFIPVAAGMAGGSSDAAAVLFGVNRIFDLGLTTDELMKRGVDIGADVPYCIMRGTALAEGIGEKLTRLPAMPQCSVIVAKPSVSVSTALVYSNLDMDGVTVHPDIDSVIRGLSGADLRMVAANMGNVLEQVTIPMHPVIAQIKNKMLGFGALNAMMSGSGPAVFGLFEDVNDAEKCLEYMRMMSEVRQAYITDIFNV